MIIRNSRVASDTELFGRTRALNVSISVSTSDSTKKMDKPTGLFDQVRIKYSIEFTDNFLVLTFTPTSLQY